MSDCTCLEPGYCPTYGRQLVGREYQWCSETGKMRDGSPMPADVAAAYRRSWTMKAALAGHDNPAGCDLRGETIGKTPCQTCNNKSVAVTTFACPLHGKAVLYGTNDAMNVGFMDALKRGETPETWICHLCKERQVNQPRRLWDRKIELPGYHLNNSAILFRGQRLMAYRQNWDNGRIVLVELDSEWQAIRGTVLKLTHGLAQEDPRLFVFRGELHVAYTAVRYEPSPAGPKHMVTDVAYARLEPTADGWIVAADYCPQYAGRAFWEKNWGFFDQGGELHAVYSISPRHQVLRIDGDQAELIADESFDMPAAIGKARGGASPVFHNGEWYSFYHGVLGDNKDRIYTAGCYTFETSGRFRPSRAMKRPLMLPKLTERPSPHMPHCVYPGGAFLAENQWQVSYGYYDSQCRAAAFDYNEVEAGLFALKRGPLGELAHRKGTSDLAVWVSVNLGNEYQLPERFEASDVVVDVGGHIGSFADACLKRGAGRVVTCEPFPESAGILRENLAAWSWRADIRPVAVGGRGASGTVELRRHPLYPSGYISLSTHRTGEVVAKPDHVPLDAILHETGPVRLLKLDCEGAEYDILSSSDLSAVQEVCGEAHRIEGWHFAAIENYLITAGFRFRWGPAGDSTRLFWAIRDTALWRERI